MPVLAVTRKMGTTSTITSHVNVNYSILIEYGMHGVKI